MRIKDPKRKKFTSDPVYCMDQTRNEFHEKIPSPLFAIYKEGKHYSVLYWDTCEIASKETLEEARQYVWEYLTKFDPEF